MKKNKKQEVQPQEELIKREQYSIFTIITDLNCEEKENVILTLGKYALAKFEDIEECKEYIDSHNYELLLSMMSIVVLTTIEKKEELTNKL